MEDKTNSNLNLKRRHLNIEAKEVILHMLKICNVEKQESGICKPLQDVVSRTAIYTGVSNETVRTIESNNWEPPKKPKKPKTSSQLNDKLLLNDREILKIKNIIRDYCIKNCKVPTITELLPHVLNETALREADVKLLWRVLYNIGYRRKQLFPKQAVLLEDPVHVSNRDEYLKTIRELRKGNQNIFYIYECVIDYSYTFFKTWAQEYGNHVIFRNKDTYILLCAASTAGFLKKATVVYKSDFNDNGHFNQNVFEKWIKDRLIPNLPKESVVIMDGAPHHCAVTDKPLSYGATKQEMLEYLRKKNIKCDEEMRRIELYVMIEENAPKQNVYIIDDILKKHNHETMRLPPYMIDLNPTQLVMDKIQQQLRESDYKKAFTEKNITKIITELMNRISKAEWEVVFEKTRSLEDEYWKKDGQFEVVMEKILQNMPNDSSSEKSGTISDSDDEL